MHLGHLSSLPAWQPHSPHPHWLLPKHRCRMPCTWNMKTTQLIQHNTRSVSSKTSSFCQGSQRNFFFEYIIRADSQKSVLKNSLKHIKALCSMLNSSFTAGDHLKGKTNQWVFKTLYSKKRMGKFINVKESTSSTQWNRDLVGGHQKLLSFVPTHTSSVNILDIIKHTSVDSGTQLSGYVSPLPPTSSMTLVSQPTASWLTVPQL